MEVAAVAQIRQNTRKPWKNFHMFVSFPVSFLPVRISGTTEASDPDLTNAIDMLWTTSFQMRCIFVYRGKNSDINKDAITDKNIIYQTPTIMILRPTLTSYNKVSWYEPLKGIRLSIKVIPHREFFTKCNVQLTSIAIDQFSTNYLQDTLFMSRYCTMIDPLLEQMRAIRREKEEWDKNDGVSDIRELMEDYHVLYVHVKDTVLEITRQSPVAGHIGADSIMLMIL